MQIFKGSAPSYKKVYVPLLLTVALIVAAGAPSGVPVLDAQGRPNLESLHQRMLPVFELAGVVYTDADEASGRLVVGVIDRGIDGLVRARLRGLSVASESVDIVETEPIVQVATLRDKVRPVVAGLQVRFSNYVCSLGFNATRNSVNGFVTASHCSTKQGRVEGTKYYQPVNQVADELIGTEIADPSYTRGAGCPPGRVCRYSDSNFSSAASGVNFNLGAIAKTTGPNNNSLDIAGTFVITGVAAAVVGQTADKVGRTTGWTSGTVSNTCVNTGVSGTNIILLCQNFVQAQVPIVAGGDSGSPVFQSAGGDNVALLGNLWGGSSSGNMFVYSPIANIEAELGSLVTH